MDGYEDPLDELGAELRAHVGGEFRRAAEDDEAAARQLMLRRRTLTDVGFELANRGDLVRLLVGPDRFVGTVVHARSDLLTLQTAGRGTIHANLASTVTLRVMARLRTGGRPVDELGPDSFRARLRQLELEEEPVTLSLPLVGETVRCRLEAVAEDHVYSIDLDGHEWFIPTGQIAAVIQRV